MLKPYVTLFRMSFIQKELYDLQKDYELVFY